MTEARLIEPVAALMRRVAAEIVMPRFRQLAAHEIAEKTPGDLVTVVDRQSEAELSTGLSRIAPGIRVLGEEACAADPSQLKRIGEGPLWIVDPIDGTGNFAAGKPPFAIMIAYAEDGVTLAGWMLDPLSGRMCHALKGEGAFVDGAKISARESGATLPVAALATHFMTPDERARIEARAKGKLKAATVPRCAGEQYPRVVLGENDISLFHRTLPWDHAPGALFLEEAGGRIAHPDGTAYRFAEDRKGLIAASSPAMWDRAAAILYS